MGVQTQPKLFVRAAAGWSHHAQAIGVQRHLHKHAIPKIQIILIFGNFEKDHLKKTFSQWSETDSGIFGNGKVENPVTVGCLASVCGSPANLMGTLHFL